MFGIHVPIMHVIKEYVPEAEKNKSRQKSSINFCFYQRKTSLFAVLDRSKHESTKCKVDKTFLSPSLLHYYAQASDLKVCASLHTSEIHVIQRYTLFNCLDRYLI